MHFPLKPKHTVFTLPLLDLPLSTLFFKLFLFKNLELPYLSLTFTHSQIPAVISPLNYYDSLLIGLHALMYPIPFAFLAQTILLLPPWVVLQHTANHTTVLLMSPPTTQRIRSKFLLATTNICKTAPSSFKKNNVAEFLIAKYVFIFSKYLK